MMNNNRYPHPLPPHILHSTSYIPSYYCVLSHPLIVVFVVISFVVNVYFDNEMETSSRTFRLQKYIMIGFTRSFSGSLRIIVSSCFSFCSWSITFVDHRSMAVLSMNSIFLCLTKVKKRKLELEDVISQQNANIMDECT